MQMLGTLKTTAGISARDFVVQFNGFMSLTSYFDINITETTYSCQFQYVFGNK